MTIMLYELLGDDDRRFSPYCWRARMAIAHKGLAAEYVPCRFTEKEKFAFSGQDRIPVIRDGETVVFDSWDIASYLEDAYPDRPSLFGGPVGRSLTRFFNEWNAVLNAPILRAIVKDIHDHSAPEDRAYFRASREKRFGRTLEALHAEREGHRPAIEAACAPLRETMAHRPFLCGAAPGYADYIVFGTFQFARSMSPYRLLEPGDRLYDWRSRMLDLFGGLGRSVAAYPE